MTRSANSPKASRSTVASSTSDSEHLAAVASELKQAIERHVEEEEETLFPKMQSDLGATEMDVLGAQVGEF